MEEFNFEATRQIVLDLIKFGFMDGHGVPIDDEKYLRDVYNELKNHPEYKWVIKMYNNYFEKEEAKK